MHLGSSCALSGKDMFYSQPEGSMAGNPPGSFHFSLPTYRTSKGNPPPHFHPISHSRPIASNWPRSGPPSSDDLAPRFGEHRWKGLHPHLPGHLRSGSRDVGGVGPLGSRLWQCPFDWCLNTHQQKRVTPQKKNAPRTRKKKTTSNDCTDVLFGRFVNSIFGV